MPEIAPLRGDGNDVMDRGDDHEKVYGGRSSDHLDGGGGSNRIFGESGSDTLTTGSGVDFLSGGKGNDMLDAGAGNDVLVGGKGIDEMQSGEGVKDFVLLTGDSKDGDTITDYDSSKDLFYFADNLTPVSVENGAAPGTAIVTFSHGGWVELSNPDPLVDLTDLTFGEVTVANALPLWAQSWPIA